MSEQTTRPSQAVRQPLPSARPARTPFPVIALSGLLGVMVLACAMCSVMLVALGSDRVLALRDQVLGRTREERVASLQQIIDVVVRGEDAWPIPGRGRLTILLMGVDRRPSEGRAPARTDAITLLSVDPEAKTAAMLSIPRDLYVPLPGLEDQGIDQSRINTAYLYGEIYNVAGGGPAEFKHTVELNFGIRVDRYVLINFAAFKQTVDALGGIDVYVPKAIYDDEFPADDDGSTIIFEVPAGLVHMDGATALRYSRTRHQDDDYHRVQRQQDVLLAIRDRLIQPQVIPQIPALVAAMGNAGRTDLNPQEMAALACMGPKIDKGAIEALPIDATMVLPWTTPTGGRVSIPNRDVIAPLVQEFLTIGHSQVAASP